MHGNCGGPFITFKMNSKKELQFTEITHLKFVLKARLQLVDHVQIACQYMQTITM